MSMHQEISYASLPCGVWRVVVAPNMVSGVDVDIGNTLLCSLEAQIIQNLFSVAPSIV